MSAAASTVICCHLFPLLPSSPSVVLTSPVSLRIHSNSLQLQLSLIKFVFVASIFDLLLISILCLLTYLLTLFCNLHSQEATFVVLLQLQLFRSRHWRWFYFLASILLYFYNQLWFSWITSCVFHVGVFVMWKTSVSFQRHWCLHNVKDMHYSLNQGKISRSEVPERLTMTRKGRKKMRWYFEE